MPTAPLAPHERTITALRAIAAQTTLTRDNFFPLLRRDLLQIYLVSDRWAPLHASGQPEQLGTISLQRAAFYDREGNPCPLILDANIFGADNTLVNKQWFRIDPERVEEI